jgi:DNA-binding XRE family transcriptional regulator
MPAQIVMIAGVEMVVIPKVEFDDIVERLEDAEDLAAANAVRLAVARGEDEVLPDDVGKALRASGASRVAVMRAHRGMTQADLAEAAGTSAAYISQIETGHRGCGADLRMAIARALRVDVDFLWPVPDMPQAAAG